jgi:hypothetical protein
LIFYFVSKVNQIQNAVEKEELKQVNLFHIAIIVRAFLSMDSNMTADNFLRLNILAGLLENIHNPMIFDVKQGSYFFKKCLNFLFYYYEDLFILALKASFSLLLRS